MENLEDRTSPATFTWVNPAGGLWHIGSNWDTGTVPGAADDAVIPDLPGNVAVTHSQDRDSIRSLTSEEAVILSGGSLELADASGINSALILSGGATLTGHGDLAVSGLLIWTGGAMTGTGTTTANGGTSFSGGAATLGRTLRNNGPAALSGPNSSLTLATGGAFNNEPGAVFDLTNNQGVFGVGVFNNPAGATLRRSVSPDPVSFAPRLNNAGTVEVRSGTLNLLGGGSHTGQFTGLFGAALGFGGNHTLAAGSAVTMPEVAFTFGTVTVGGRYDVSQGTTVSGATVTFTPAADLRSVGGALTINSGTLSCNSGEALTATLIYLNAGTLTGASNISAELLFWSGGTMSGSGTTTVTGVAFNGGAATLGRTLNNNASALMASQNASLTILLGAVFNNRPGAHFLLGNSQGIFGQGAFNNPAGAVFTRLQDTGTATVHTIFNNGGAVHVESGTLNLAGGGNHVGRFDGLPGTTLQFGGGAHEFQTASDVAAAHVVFSAGTANVSGLFKADESSTFSGAAVTFNPGAALTDVGTVLVVNSGLVTFNSGEPLAVRELVLNGGTLTGTDHLEINGPFTWRGGTLSGSGTATARDRVELSGGSMTLGRTFHNTDRARLEGAASSLTLLTGAVWNNPSLSHFTLNALGIFGSGTFNNQGVLAVVATSTIQARLNNSRLVGVVFGTLTLGGGGNYSGDFIALGEATLVFSGGAHDFQSSASLTMPSVVFAGGTINVNGAYDVVGSTVFSGATVTFNAGAAVANLGANLAVLGGLVRLDSGVALAPATLFLAGGTLTGSDSMTVGSRFTWWGGTLSGTGTTTANGGIDLSGFNMTLGRVLTNNGTATWTGLGNISATSDGVFNNNGTFDVQNDQFFTSPACLGTFNNAGLFQKTASYGTTTIGLLFSNTGTLDVQTGIVNFSCAPLAGRPHHPRSPGPVFLALVAGGRSTASEFDLTKPDAAGQAAWVEEAQRERGRTVVAGAFLASPEAHRQLVDRYYTTLLGRPAEPVGQRAWSDFLDSGRGTGPAVGQAVLASEEYFARARVSSF